MTIKLITPEMIADLRRMHAAATPGPWEVEPSPVFPSERIAAPFISPEGYRGRKTVSDAIYGPDADLTVAMHNTLPALLDAAEERDALRAKLAELRAKLTDDHWRGRRYASHPFEESAAKEIK